MVTLEQVRLLETKVTRTIEYVRKVTEENASLKGKLETYERRIDELEVLIKRFKDEQGRIEEGILSALNRLNQFEDILESTLSVPESKSEAIKKNDIPAPVIEKEPEELPEEEDAPDNELDIF